MWGNGYGEGNLQNTEIQNQLNALRTQMQDNQNTNAIMDALKGNGCQIGQLAQSLNCDFNTLNAAICDVRQGIGNLAGQVGFSAERIINSVLTGNLQMTQALKDCCCQTQQSILKGLRQPNRNPRPDLCIAARLEFRQLLGGAWFLQPRLPKCTGQVRHHQSRSGQHAAHHRHAEHALAVRLAAAVQRRTPRIVAAQTERDAHRRA